MCWPAAKENMQPYNTENLSGEDTTQKCYHWSSANTDHVSLRYLHGNCSCEVLHGVGNVV